MPGALKRNGLTLVYLALFLGALVVMSVTGHRRYDAERADHGEPPVSYTAEFVDHGLRVVKSNVEIQLDAEQQVWIRSLTVVDDTPE